jgi:hypothetical protein
MLCKAFHLNAVSSVIVHLPLLVYIKRLKVFLFVKPERLANIASLPSVLGYKLLKRPCAHTLFFCAVLPKKLFAVALAH